MKKTAIITGGTRGIGLASAKRLSKGGFNVVVTGTKPKEEYDKNFDTLTDYAYIQSDVTDAKDRERLVAETVRLFGGVHVLVNNAGVAPIVRTDLLDMTEDSFDCVMAVNTKSVMFLTQIVAKQMITQPVVGKKRGTIINISSCSSTVSSTGRGEYCVSKAGVSMLTKLFADRLSGENIFVHELRPGIIETDMTTAVKDKYNTLLAKGTFPIARWGTPKDVAEAVFVFAGESFLYTTGNVVEIDGGFHIQRL